jgi:hypothetical protein
MESTEKMESELAWQIPRLEFWPGARLSGEGTGQCVFWLSLLAPVAAYVAISSATRSWGVWLLVIYVLTVLTLLARRLVAAGQVSDVRLTAEGAWWRSPQGEWYEIPSRIIQGFYLAPSPDADAESLSLTLHLADGFKSWPWELAAPVTPEGVREFLITKMHVAEVEAPTIDKSTLLPADAPREAWERLLVEESRYYGYFVDVLLEDRTWRFEGSRPHLLALCERWTAAAMSMRIAPPYAQPERVELGGYALQVTLEADEETWLSNTTFCGPPEWHKQFALRLRQWIESVEVGGTFAIHPPGTAWKVQMVVQGESFDPAVSAKKSMQSTQTDQASLFHVRYS